MYIIKYETDLCPTSTLVVGDRDNVINIVEVLDSSELVHRWHIQNVELVEFGLYKEQFKKYCQVIST